MSEEMIGKTVSQYKIIEKIGEGGMGVVYRAEDTRLHRSVALKFLPRHASADPEIQARFFQEAQAASALDHPGIATIYEIEETNGEWFIAMAFIEGQTLKERITSSLPGAEEPSPLSIGEAIDAVIQVAEGLAAAHAKGIIHRDMKSDNIMLTNAGQVKITDFGLAKFKDCGVATRTGTVLGTPAYMAPEQAQCEETDHRSDIFSLGIILYEMITGRLPFAGDNDLAILYSIVHQPPKPATEIISSLPPHLEQIISRALEKDLEKRYQNVEEMLTDLYSLRDETRPLRSLPSSRDRSRQSSKRAVGRFLIPVSGILILIMAFLLFRPLIFKQDLVSEPMPIAIIGFENQTGDPSYDYLQKAIPNLLITSLEQSKNLRVTTWERMHDLLKRTGKEEVELIESDLGFELCRLDGVNALVIGSFTMAEDLFATDVKVIDVETKRILQSHRSQGKGVGSILENQVDDLSKEICRMTGLSGQSTERARLPIVNVTTNSMEAYNYFLRGKEDSEKYYFDDARRFLEKATELDSTFAVAYYYLARINGWLGNTVSMKEAFERAKQLAQHATAKERFYINAAYARDIEGNSEKAEYLYTALIKQYPKEKNAHYSLATYYADSRRYNEAIDAFTTVLDLDPNFGLALNEIAYTYAHIGQYDEAISYFKQYASISPGDANPFDSMAEVYLKMGRCDEALSKFQEALDVKPDFGADWKIGYIHALQENYDEAMEWIDQYISVAQSTGLRADGWLWKGFYHCWLGNTGQALASLEEAQKLAEEVEHTTALAFADWIRAWIYLDQGNMETSREKMEAWFRIIAEEYPTYTSFFQGFFEFYMGVVALEGGGLEGSLARREKIKGLLNRIAPAYEQRLSYYNDLLNGEIFFMQDSLENALEIGRALSSPDIPYMFTENIIRYNAPFPRDLLARVHMKREEIDPAIAAYEQLLRFDPAGTDRRLIPPRYHYILGVLYEQKGEREKAAEQFEQFLDIWKNADKGRPEVVDARERLAGLW